MSLTNGKSYMSDFPKLSKTEFAVLDLLRSGREMYGLEMVKASNGVLKRGSVYVYLTRMSEKGYVSSRTEKNPNDPGMPRRKYKIEGLGQRVLSANEVAAAAMADAWSPVGGV